MRLIDADLLEPDAELDDGEYWAYSKSQIDNAETVCRWIPVSERLPEDDTKVFVYLFDRNSPYVAWVTDSVWYTEDFEVEQENEPIAWMPLPEPYREENES